MKKLLLMVAAIIFLYGNSYSQVTISGSTGVDGTYTSLTNAAGAFLALNGSVQTGNTILVTITADVTTEAGTNSLNAGAWTSLTIKPSGARTISGTVAGAPMINLNGADNVTINGLNDGTNTLTISNLSNAATTLTSTIRFIADATNNTITNCTVLGSSVGALATNTGTIYFATATTTGNDNNTISYCKIGPAGASLPSKGIYSNGTTSTATTANSTISINNCEIFDYFLTGGCAGVYALTGNTDWTIANNKVYQTAARTFTATGTMYGIYFSNSTYGNNVQIGSNTVGFANNAGTGTLTLTGSTVVGAFVGIYMNTMTSAANTCSISSNTISDIALASSTGVCYGIQNASGVSTNAIDIKGNTVKNIASTTSTGTCYGIAWASAATMTVANNNVHDISRTGAGTIYGIYSGSSSATENILGNTVYNLTSTAVAASTIRGISQGTATGTKTFQNNTIYSLSGLGGTTIVGLYLGYATIADISGNTIYSLTSTGGTAGAVYGIQSPGSSVTTVNISKNKIYGLTSSSTNPALYGIFVGAGPTHNIFNNIIGDLTTTAANAAIPLAGIYISGGTTSNVYYNTVNLSGTSSGALFGSAAIYASSTPTLNLRNNIFVNTSTPAGATGYTSAYRRSSTTLTSYASTSNNNLFYAGTPGANNLIFWDGTNAYQTITAFQTAVAPRDAFSISVAPNWVSSTGANASFLHINTSISTGIESGGANIATYTDDFDGDIRQGNTGYSGAGTAPDMGADEFAGLPSYTCAAPAPGNTVSTANALCLGQSITLTLQNASTGTGNSFQWQSSADGGGYSNIVGATSASYSTTPAASAYYQCVVTCQNGPATATSTPVQITFANSVTSTTPGSRCGTGTVSLQAVGSAGTLNWYAAATGGASLGTGSPFTTPSISTTTSFYVGAEAASAGMAPVGTGTGANTTSTYPAAYGSYWGNARAQYLILASDLLAAGFSAGNLNSIAFDVTALGSPVALTGYTITLGTSAVSTLTTWQTLTSPAVVFGPATYTPVVGTFALNTHTFAAPYVWNGSSNIIVEVCFNNGVTGSTNTLTRMTTTSYSSSIFYGTDGVVSGGVCATATVSGSALSRPNMQFSGTVSCSSPRSAVVATVNTPPAFTVSADQTICNNSVATLDVTSTLSDFDSYIWSPIAGLYTDLACTTPYTGTSASSVHFKSATAGVNTFTCTASNSATFCANTANSVVSNLTASPAISAAPASLCVSGSTVLTTVPATGYGIATFQWQNSANDVTFSDIAGANAISYTTPTLTSTTYYKLVVKVGAAVCTESNVVTVIVNNPVITSTTPATRCGIGTVTLNATADPGTTINWFAAASGGASLGTGASFVTPSLSTTTTFYAEPLSGGSSFNVGLATDLAVNLGSYPAYGMFFSTVSAATINSVKIYPSTAGTLIVSLKNAAAVTVDTRTFTIVAGEISTTVQKTLALNFAIPAASTGWQIYYDLSINRGGGTYSYPYTSNGFSITGNTLDGNNITGGSRFYFYDWSVTTGCAGPRLAAIATVNPATALTITGDQSTCSATPVSMTITSTLSDYDSYTWSPVTGLYTDAACTVPYVDLGNASTVYAKSATAGAITYTCAGSNSSSGCSNVATSIVTTALTPVTPTTTGYGLCVSGTIPVGQGLQSTGVGAAVVTGSQTINFDVAVQPTETNAAPGNVVASASMASIPAGAIVTSIVINYNNLVAIGSSWESDIYLGLSGAIINAAAPGTGALGSAGTFNYTRTATTGITATNAGGTLNLLYWDNVSDNAGDEATFPTGTAVASVTVNYTYPDPAAIKWYTALTGGTLLGSGNTFNPIGIDPALPNSNTPGTYTYYAEVTSGTCVSARAASALVIGSSPTITASASPATPVCAGTAVTLSSTPVGGGAPYTYSWRVSGLEVSTLQSFSVSPLTTTTYDVTLTDNCAQTTSASVTVTVKPLPTAVASSDSPLCSGSTLNLTGTSDIGTSFSWTGPNAFTSAIQNPSIASVTTAANGTYSLITTFNGCSSVAGTTIVVIHQTPEAIIVTPAAQTILAGDIQLLTATGGQVQSTLLSENFNGSVPGWTTINNSTGGTPANAAWGLYLSSVTFHSNDNTNFVMSNSDSQGLGGTTSTYLMTPVMNSTGYTSLSLSFWHFFNWYSASDFAKVEVSTDGGTTWIAPTLATYITDQGLATAFVHTTLSLNAYINQANLKIRFNYAAAYGFYWAIDNVEISGSQSAPITWKPLIGLYDDASASIAYTGTATTTVYAKPAVTTLYTATSTAISGCLSAKDVTITVATAPTVSTDAISAIGINTATSGGNVTVDGGFAVTSRGVCWSLLADPTILDYKTTDGSGTGTFTSNLTGLNATTLYHVRAYATSLAGTAYGSDVSFTTLGDTKTLNLTAYLQGFWNGTGMNQTQDVDIDYNVWNKFTGTTVDTLSVYLAEATAPYAYVFQAHGVNISTTGAMTISVPGALFGNYYISIIHRSSVETWSAAPVSFSEGVIGYDFSVAAAQAFGANQFDLLGDGTVWALFGGEIYGSGSTLPADGWVDLNDLNPVYNDNVGGAFGYKLEDITGDGFVDLSDLNIVYNNLVISVGPNTPINPMKRPKKFKQ